ncbi:right-handed parallel beta-helix repeat-containing protein [Pseudomonas sp. CGJS7]|uniref:right-handed parallel beta-helix repeat-containing protein n=1 Tax=Pseudomonas sp. CGJS7 TaxID=3109348 RepID=UPI00300B167E
MRLIPMAGLALTGLLLSANALACDTILDPQRVTIFGPGKFCLSANRSVPIDISGSDVELDCRGRTLTNRPANGGPAGAVFGIRVSPGTKVTVRNCRVDGFPIGIDMNTQAGGQLLNNTVLRAQDTPIVVRGDNHDPSAEPNRVVGNRVIGFPSDGMQPSPPGPALRLLGLPRAVISNNVVAGYNGNVGLELWDSADAQLIGNQFLDFDSSHMIRLNQSPRVRVVHNTIMSRQGGVIHGLSGAVDATCVENVFVNTVRSGFSDCAVTRYNIERPQPPTGP